MGRRGIGGCYVDGRRGGGGVGGEDGVAMREEVSELIGYNHRESTNISDCQLLPGLVQSIAREMELLTKLPG